MTVVPMAMAAIKSAPPRMSQRIGLSPREPLTLEEAVPFAVMDIDRCQSRTRKQFLNAPDPAHSYGAEMEVTLGI